MPEGFSVRARARGDGSDVAVTVTVNVAKAEHGNVVMCRIDGNIVDLNRSAAKPDGADALSAEATGAGCVLRGVGVGAHPQAPGSVGVGHDP